MKNNFNKINSFIFFVLVLVWQVVFAVPVSAADQTGSTSAATTTVQSVKDSDFDGLIDSAETDKFHTDFLKWDTDGDGYSDGAEVVVGSDPLDKNDPAGYLSTSTVATAPPAVVKTEPLITPWLISRSSALAAFILMFLVVFIGTGITTDFILRFASPDFSWSIHRFLSIGMVVMIAVHVVSLLFDKFINFNWKDVLIPFYSGFKPGYLALGILAAYMLAIVIFTSIYLVERTPNFWKVVHYSTYPMFVMSLLHGLFIGTDSRLPAIKIIYLVTGSLAAVLFLYRFIFIFRRGRVSPQRLTGQLPRRA
jgi:hypothetical protein